MSVSYVALLVLVLITNRPVSTYGGQGSAKRGIDAAAHAIIYMCDQKPAKSSDETKLSKRAIAVNPARADQKLDRMSRLNFGKVYTVEHDVKVMDIGTVADASMAYLEAYWTNQKNR